MTLPTEKAKEIGVIRSVEDIKISNEMRSEFKEGIVYDAFEPNDPAAFAFAASSKFDEKKTFQRQVFSNYIYPPLKRSFKSVVRITALVLVATRKFKKLVILKRIRENQIDASELKRLDFHPAKFTVFNCQIVYKECNYPGEEKLASYFSVKGVPIGQPQDVLTNEIKEELWLRYFGHEFEECFRVQNVHPTQQQPLILSH